MAEKTERTFRVKPEAIEEVIELETKVYRVKSGHVFGRDSQYKGGDEVNLTDAEALGLQDRLDLVGGSEEEAAEYQKTGKTTVKPPPSRALSTRAETEPAPSKKKKGA